MAPTPEDKNDFLDIPEDNLNLDDTLENSLFQLDDINFDELDLEEDSLKTEVGLSSDQDFDLSLEEDIPLFDDQLPTLESEEELDLTKDLGLQENLSIDKEEDSFLPESDPSSMLDDFTEEETISEFDEMDLSLLDKEIQLEEEDDSFYGVALKEGPETIVTYTPSISPNIVDDMVEQQIDENIINISFPEKKPTDVNPEEEDYLKINIEDEIDPKKLIEESLASFKRKDTFVSDEELSGLGLNSLEEQEVTETTIAEEEIKILDGNEDIASEITIEPLPQRSIDDLEMDSITIDLNALDDINLEFEESDFSMQEENLELSEEQEIEDDHIDLNSIGETNSNDDLKETMEEELMDDLSTQKEITSEKSKDSLLEKDYEEDFNLDFDELIQEEEEEDFDDDSDEKITIDTAELEKIEDDFFPSDEEMPVVDEDISRFTEESADNAISSLEDAEDIFASDSAESEEEEQDEEETIALSTDELDNILKTTDLVEEEIETETIDIDSLDAHLIEYPSEVEEIKQLAITPDEEEEIYSSLKSEMQVKENEIPDEKTELLKKDIKMVLSYLDQLLDALPEEKIKEFAESNEFDIYRKLFEELNIKSK